MIKFLFNSSGAFIHSFPVWFKILETYLFKAQLLRDLKAQRWNIFFVFLELWLNTDAFCALLIWSLGIDQAVIPFDRMHSALPRNGGDILADGGKYQALFVVEDWDYFGS